MIFDQICYFNSKINLQKINYIHQSLKNNNDDFIYIILTLLSDNSIPLFTDTIELIPNNNKIYKYDNGFLLMNIYMGCCVECRYNYYKQYIVYDNNIIDYFNTIKNIIDKCLIDSDIYPSYNDIIFEFNNYN